MNPLTRLFRRSRVFRVAFYISMVPVWILIGYVSFDSFGAYSQVGDVTLLLLIMFFAAWAWWYGEDRDRRRAAKANRTDDDGRPPATG
ncbi:MAG TPA: hypothetical protein VH268_07175 [Solirubrobacterales bacterium]|nr:hypothetical protein [Solirubrobacterales bacterium]